MSRDITRPSERHWLQKAAPDRRQRDGQVVMTND
jgi:hypothetical protein